MTEWTVDVARFLTEEFERRYGLRSGGRDDSVCWLGLTLGLGLKLRLRLREGFFRTGLMLG